MSARLTSMLERAFNIVRLGLLFKGGGAQGGKGEGDSFENM